MTRVGSTKHPNKNVLAGNLAQTLKGWKSLKSLNRHRQSIPLARNNTAATRDIRASRRRIDFAHGIGKRIEVPLLVWARNEPSTRVPARNPGVSIVEEEEAQFLGGGAVTARDAMPAASVIHFVFEEVAMENAAVNERDRNFPVVVAIPRHKMPSVAGVVSVGAWHWGIPVFCFVDGALNAVAPLEPVDRAEDGA